MTWAIYIALFLALFIGVLNILPTAGALSPNIVAGISFVVGEMKAWNFLFPITELLICTGAVISLMVGIWVWHAFRWLLHLIRGSGSN